MSSSVTAPSGAELHNAPPDLKCPRWTDPKAIAVFPSSAGIERQLAPLSSRQMMASIARGRAHAA